MLENMAFHIADIVVCDNEHIPGCELLYQTISNHFAGKTLVARLQIIDWYCGGNGSLIPTAGETPAIPGYSSTIQTDGGRGLLLKFMVAPSRLSLLPSSPWTVILDCPSNRRKSLIFVPFAVVYLLHLARVPRRVAEKRVPVNPVYLSMPLCLWVCE